MARLVFIALALVLALAAAGCGRDGDAPQDGERPAIGLGGDDDSAAADLGFPTFATKNTTRVGGSDATATAAAVARAVYPATTRNSRPGAVALVDRGDWRTALAAAALMAPPIDAPMLLTDGEEMPAASEAALRALRPTGADEVGRAQLIRIGETPEVDGLRSSDVGGANPFARARAIAGVLSAARGRTPDQALIVSAENASFAMPAAAWAAKSGDPILFTTRDEVPPETVRALEAMDDPRIYVLGPSQLISPRATRRLRRLGEVTRLGGPDPVRNAIQFAIYRDSTFGWGVANAGHGLVFARAGQPLDAAAAAPLSSAGTYGPLLLLDSASQLARPLQQYLLDIQPGFREDPVRGVYNHGWIIGDEDAISVPVQGRIDSFLEIVPVEIPEEVPGLDG